MVMLGLALTFTIESIHEKEPRATKFGGAGVFAALVIFVLIIWTPAMRLSITVFFLFGGLFIFICLIPGKPNPGLLKGSTSYMLNEGKRFDERDIVFARARMTKNGSSEQAGIYRRYYEKHPEKEEPDAKRRNKGLIGKLGKIDNCQPSSIAMTKAGFDIPNLLGPHAVAQHNRHYDTLMVPLAIDAGLGELGRQGYLIAPKYGARVRIFATLTDMELIPDRPISIGAEEFCSKCKKCAEACPSRSIPSNESLGYFHRSLRDKDFSQNFSLSQLHSAASLVLP